MISRNAKILAATGAAVLLTGGAVGAAQLDKAVNVSVDGTATTAHVFGSTVGDVLDSQSIAVKPGDVVVPAADAAISDGDTITVKYARMLKLTVDGKTRQIRTTETTVDGALLALRGPCLDAFRRVLAQALSDDRFQRVVNRSNVLGALDTRRRHFLGSIDAHNAASSTNSPNEVHDLARLLQRPHD